MDHSTCQINSTSLETLLIALRLLSYSLHMPIWVSLMLIKVVSKLFMSLSPMFSFTLTLVA